MLKCTVGKTDTIMQTSWFKNFWLTWDSNPYVAKSPNYVAQTSFLQGYKHSTIYTLINNAH